MTRKNQILSLLGSLLFVIAGIFSLATRCSKASETSPSQQASSTVVAVYYQQITDTEDSRFTFYHEEGSDVVTKAVTQSSITYKGLGASSKEQVQEGLEDQVFARYQNIEGVAVSFDYTDTMVTMLVSVDYTVLDFEAFSEIEGNESFKGTTHVSLKQSVEGLKKQGYKEVKDGQFVDATLE